MTHILWGCTSNLQLYKQDNIRPDLLEERWQTALTSSEPTDQLWAVQQARTIAERLPPSAMDHPVV
ncbi:hypothetical protein HPB50_003207 [Hyalomma asiaticum]|uniref:Uncharacterized protein n=1 Tax=Hyalomma asiaticum TaxID=266040 RepID=A0ACB7TEI0_HYAAI|nr:hypothetical protein HPB50_003207 [Hyalomma asiaticum]